LPYSILSGVIEHLVGSPSGWLLVLGFFPLATTAVGSLVGGGLVRRLTSGLLYVVNPFVLERLYAGHIAFLYGYALLPLLVRSATRARTAQGVRRLEPAVWIALAGGMSVHFLWIGAFVVAVAVGGRRPRPA